jgi:hypothetical protein
MPRIYNQYNIERRTSSVRSYALLRTLQDGCWGFQIRVVDHRDMYGQEATASLDIDVI